MGIQKLNIIDNNLTPPQPRSRHGELNVTLKYDDFGAVRLLVVNSEGKVANLLHVEVNEEGKVIVRTRANNSFMPELYVEPIGGYIVQDDYSVEETAASHQARLEFRAAKIREKEEAYQAERRRQQEEADAQRRYEEQKAAARHAPKPATDVLAGIHQAIEALQAAVNALRKNA